MILLTLDFTNLTNFKLLLIQTFTFYLYKPLLLLIVMTQKKATPKKAPKRAQRVERVEHSAPKDNKKRARSPSDDDEEESDGRSKKERRSNRNKLADTTQKTAL